MSGLRMLACAVACLPCAGAWAAEYYVAKGGNDAAAGTAAAPWGTIQHGVTVLKAGDTLWLGPGIYREAIRVDNGGTAAAPITISAMPGAHVVVTGADPLRDGWRKEPGADAVYSHEWAYRFPIGGPNDLTHPGDKEHEVTGRAEQIIHADRLLRQVLRREQVSHGTFFVDLDAKRLYVWLRDSANPADSDVWGSVRTTWLTGGDGVSYVHVRGITFRYAANHAQRGAFATGRDSKGWLVEDCVFERSNASGGSFTGDGHRFRRCVFQDNGQLGFGTSRCDNTVMEQCGIYRNNIKGYSNGWEAGGLKVTMSRNFVFDHCRSVDNRGVGIWFDIGNEKSEVRNCYIADNDEAGIFYEISFSLYAHDNLVVNNANRGESPGGSWGSAGITLSSSEGCTVENNTLVGNRDGIDFREQDRTTPRIGQSGPEVRILNRNHTIRNNIVAYSQAFNIGFWMDTNFFGAHPSGGDSNLPVFEDPKTLSFRFANNLLWPLPGRPNYLYGAAWRAKSRQLATPAEFTAASGIADSSRVADPLFTDVLARDYTPRSGSPVKAMGVGYRGTVPGNGG